MSRPRTWTELLVVALAAALGACAPVATPPRPPPALGSGEPQSSGDLAPCRREPPLPIAPMVVEWSQQERTRRLELKADGSVSEGSVVVARVVGACLVAPDGALLLSVWSDGAVRAAAPSPRGHFEQSSRLRVAARTAGDLGELLVTDDQQCLAVSEDGQVWRGPLDGEAFSLPAHVTGFSRVARRTALLLLALGPRLRA